MTAQELIEKLKIEAPLYKEFVYSSEGGKVNIAGLELEMVHSARSDDGDHDRWCSVFKVGEQYFEINSFYDSNNGRDFYGDEYSITEVKPVERKIIVYQVEKIVKV